MKHFKINPMVLAMAVALPAAVHAQNETIEEVVVTGSFRDSLANALNIKKGSAGAVDAIVAEDIADFPDLNLAESLQRIPGVAITRAGGEGRNISVRGLGPDFTRVRINGMEAVSTTGGTDSAGGTNRGRGFDFNTFSSDLFSSLIVRKTSSAEIEEGSLGATVELKSAQPFDFDGFVLTAAGQVGYNDLSEKSDPRASVLVSNIFADGKVGALFSLSYSDRTVQDEGFSTVRWSNLSGRAPFYGSYQGDAAAPELSEINNAFRPRIPRFDSYIHEVERLGASGSVQFRPTDATEISLDLLYSKHDASRQETFMQGSVNNSGTGLGSNSQIDVLDYRIERDGLVYAELDNVRLLSENRYDELTSEFTQATLSLKHEFSDSLRLNAQIGQAKSEYENPIQNTIIMRADGQQLTWDFSRGGDSYLLFGDSAYLPESWSTHSVRQRPNWTDNTYDSAAISLEYDLTDSLTLKGGVNYKKFENYGEGSRIVDGNGAFSEGTYGLNISPYIITYDSGLGDGRPWLIPDVQRIGSEAAINGQVGIENWSTAVRRQDTYGVTEETSSAWIQLDFNSQIGEVPVRGDIGFRYFKTDQSSTAWQNLTGSDYVQYWVDHDYDDILPSVNIVFEPIEDVLIRLGYSEGISRAGIGSLKSDAIAPSVSGTNLTLSSGGNPRLEPTKAASYDLGIELYFENDAALSAALFYKDIESHIQTLRTNEVGTTVGVTQEMAQTACAAYPTGYGEGCNENLYWTTAIPLNGPGGDLYGFEISYQQPFTFLPGFLSNFGFIGSFTYVKSQMDYLDEDGNVRATLDLMDLSNTSTAATLYYEQGPFSARVSAANREDYLTGGINPGGEGADVGGAYGTTNIDFAAAYQFNDNLKFTLEAINLTDEPELQWIKSGDELPHYYHKTGTQYYLGVQYKY